MATIALKSHAAVVIKGQGNDLKGQEKSRGFSQNRAVTVREDTVSLLVVIRM